MTNATMANAALTNATAASAVAAIAAGRPCRTMWLKVDMRSSACPLLYRRRPGPHDNTTKEHDHGKCKPRSLLKCKFVTIIATRTRLQLIRSFGVGIF